jgi:hypothetical protein
MQSVTTLPVLQAVSDSTDHYLGLQPIIKGRTNAEYVNSNLRFNPSSNTLTLNANLNIRSGAVLGNALAANTVTGDKLGQSAISANNISNLVPIIGLNQVWANVTSSRALSTTYTNTTGKPIQVYIVCTGGNSNGVQITIGGTVPAQLYTNIAGGRVALFAIIPDRTTYSLSDALAIIHSWLELR